MSKNTKTLTNALLYNLLPALSTLIAKDTPMPVTIKLRKTLLSVRSVVTLLDEVRQVKIAAHTSGDQEGKPVTNEEAFAADMEIMLKETSDVEIHPISVTEFPEDFAMSTADFDILKESFIIID